MGRGRSLQGAVIAGDCAHQDRQSRRGGPGPPGGGPAWGRDMDSGPPPGLSGATQMVLQMQKGKCGAVSVLGPQASALWAAKPQGALLRAGCPRVQGYRRARGGGGGQRWGLPRPVGTRWA